MCTIFIVYSFNNKRSFVTCHTRSPSILSKQQWLISQTKKTKFTPFEMWGTYGACVNDKQNVEFIIMRWRVANITTLKCIHEACLPKQIMTKLNGSKSGFLHPTNKKISQDNDKKYQNAMWTHRWTKAIVYT